METMITKLKAIIFGSLANMLVSAFGLPSDAEQRMTSKDRLEVALRRIATRMSVAEHQDDRIYELVDRINKIEEFILKEEIKSIQNGDHLKKNRWGYEFDFGTGVYKIVRRSGGNEEIDLYTDDLERAMNRVYELNRKLEGIKLEKSSDWEKSCRKLVHMVRNYGYDYDESDRPSEIRAAASIFFENFDEFTTERNL